MSLIVAGTCKTCGQKFSFSFGHPVWYDDVIVRKQKPSQNYLEMDMFKSSGLCPGCYLDAEAGTA